VLDGELEGMHVDGTIDDGALLEGTVEDGSVLDGLVLDGCEDGRELNGTLDEG
jgi:hypothetical protein